MIYDLNYLKDFQDKKYLLLENLLKNHTSMSEEEIESVLFGLVEISESLLKIYLNIIPSIIENKDINKDELEDLLCELRTQFRHIEYHINDGKLSNY